MLKLRIFPGKSIAGKRRTHMNVNFENPVEKTRTQKIVRSLFNFAEKCLINRQVLDVYGMKRT